MPQSRWDAVDRYIGDRLLPFDSMLDEVLRSNAQAGLPLHDVSPAQGKLLNLLVRLSGARRILEIGTLGAYSTIWLGRALPDDGSLITLEADRHHAKIARANIARAGLSKRVTLIEGPALETLPKLKGEQPFDFVFIDADKPSNPQYLAWAIKLSRSGAVIVADNVVRDGAVADNDSTDPKVLGIRLFFDAMAGDPRLEATAIQTVGAKGYDGFAIAIVGG